MAVRFYNPASRITETIKFDSPLRDEKGQPLVAYHNLDIPAQSFFEIPTELSVPMGDEEPTQVAVTLPRIVREQYKFSHCVVMIDPTRDAKKKPIADDDNLATNDKDAEIKAKKLWKKTMFDLVREHEDRVREAKDAGRRPLRAVGTIRHALTALGVEDPANDVEDVVQRKQDTSENEELKRRLAALEKIILDSKKA